MTTTTSDQMQFDDLCPDILEQIFKYFTIKERVQRELVCRDWAPILRSVWLQQRTLSIQTRQGPTYNPQQLCRKPGHRVHESDIVRTKWCPYLDGCLLDGLFKHCQNLTTLVLGHSYGPWAADAINSQCNRLECFRGPTSIFIDLDSEKLTRLRCVELEQGLEYRLDFGVKRRLSSLQHVFKFELDTLYINFKLGLEDVDIIRSGLRKRTEIYYAFSRDHDIISRLIQIEHVKLIGLSLPCLQKVPVPDPDSDMFDVSFAVPDVHSLREIRWTWSPDFAEMNLWPLLARCGPELKRLDYIGGSLSFKTIEVLANNCPNVTDLELFFDDVEDIVDVQLFKYFGSLRLLSLMSSKLIVELFDEILGYAPKLRTVLIELMSIGHSRPIAEAVNRYAMKYPNRSVQLVMSRASIYNRKPVQDRRCPIPDKDKCQNLTIVCDY